MIDVYYWPTPNGKKVTIMLEECGLPYEIKPINIQEGQQKSESFLSLNPNGRIPALVDTDAGGAPQIVFESGAILIYLAEKTGQLMPQGGPDRYAVLQWLMWQMGGIGPMAGQASHFLNAAPEPIAYAQNRFVNETTRLYGVLERTLQERAFVAGAYSIADIAIYPWIVPYARQGQEIANFPALQAWMQRVGERKAVKRGMEAGQGLRKS